MLERPEVRDILSLLRVACDHSDSASLMRLLATPRFGLGATALAALAGIANTLNLESQYRALVMAGLVPADAPRGQWDALVREHRDSVINSVFVADLLLRDDLPEQLWRPSSIWWTRTYRRSRPVRRRHCADSWRGRIRCEPSKTRRPP